MAYTFHGIPFNIIDFSIKTNVNGEKIPNGKTLTTTNVRTIITDLNFDQADFTGIAQTPIPEWANHISIYAVGGGGGGGGGSGGILFNNAPNNEWKYTTGGSGAGGGAGGTAYVQMVDISSNINTSTVARSVYATIGKGGLAGTGGVMVNHGGNSGANVFGSSGNSGTPGGMTNVSLSVLQNMGQNVVQQFTSIMSADGGNEGGGGYRSNIYSGVPDDINNEYRLALPGNQNSPFYGISNALNYGTFDGIPFAIAATRGQQRSEGLVFRPEGGSNNADDVPGGVGAQHGSNNTIFQDPVIVGDGGNGGNSRLASNGLNGDAGRNGYVRIAFFGQAD